ncbi:hypothetical protein KKC88_01350 [Patescibacteria group bacterium]|nr:hypothetical protein [Patescibacteria group bacterium]MBU1673473.1 hypothetical protein [Patescibacteria group bacterium]
MQIYQTNKYKLSGSNYREVRKQAIFCFNDVRRGTKRKPYLRSAYFKKQKIFFDFFWDHLLQKNPKERFIRLKYLSAAIDLVKNSRNHPISKQNPNIPKEILHRFKGYTKEKEIFYVQIKENKQNGKKYFISCFPGK